MYRLYVRDTPGDEWELVTKRTSLEKVNENLDEISMSPGYILRQWIIKSPDGTIIDRGKFDGR